MMKTSRFLLAAAILGFVACSEKEPGATTTAPLNLPAAQPAGNTAQAAAGALNPEHGQPNHRCDIPVGAPLSTPAQPNLNVPQSFTPPPMQSSQAVAASGINPPHGQPGHDCSVAVGAPLNK
ncbi:hypothetical protein ACFSRY_04005 [Pontibacter locisalis]|uniref:Lipoprotein n=1 Tax=Pontibacter locisalis TaxID=1719035 RepID=A0ABW5IHB2_9BACT